MESKGNIVDVELKLSTEYGRLCQELGHLVSNMEKLEARIDDVRAAIRGLDAVAPKLREPARRPPTVQKQEN